MMINNVMLVEATLGEKIKIGDDILQAQHRQICGKISSPIGRSTQKHRVMR